MMSSAQSAQAATILAGLERAYTAAALAAEDSWNPFVNIDASEKTALYVYRRTIDQLDGEFYADVNAGRRTYDWWYGFARDTHDNLRQLSSSISSWTFGAVASAAASNAGNAVKNTANTIAWATGGTLLLVVAAFIALVVLRFRAEARA